MEVSCCVTTIVLNPICRPENPNFTSSLVLFLRSLLAAQSSRIMRLLVFFAKCVMSRRMFSTLLCATGNSYTSGSGKYFHCWYVLLSSKVGHTMKIQSYIFNKYCVFPHAVIPTIIICIFSNQRFR